MCLLLPDTTEEHSQWAADLVGPIHDPGDDDEAALGTDGGLLLWSHQSPGRSRGRRCDAAEGDRFCYSSSVLAAAGVPTHDCKKSRRNSFYKGKYETVLLFYLFKICRYLVEVIIFWVL